MKQPKTVSKTRIYIDCVTLLNEILEITPNFPRAYKYSIGNKRKDSEWRELYEKPKDERKNLPVFADGEGRN